MAGTKEYVLKINLGGSNSNKLKAKEDEATQNPSVKEVLQGVIKTVRLSATATVVGMVATQTLNYITSRVEIETGNSRVQDQINAAKQIGSQVASIAMAGLVGGWAGAAVAAVGVGIGYAQQYAAYDFAKRQEAAALTIQRERAGLAWAVNTQRRL